LAGAFLARAFLAAGADFFATGSALAAGAAFFAGAAFLAGALAVVFAGAFLAAAGALLAVDFRVAVDELEDTNYLSVDLRRGYSGAAKPVPVNSRADILARPW
jgi:hypothetical protein